MCPGQVENTKTTGKTFCRLLSQRDTGAGLGAPLTEEGRKSLQYAQSL